MQKIFVAFHSIIEKDGKILVLKRSSKDPFSADCWDLPGGVMNFGEEVVAALKREVKEECGLEIETLSPMDVSTRIDNEEQYVAVTFICEYKSGTVKLSKDHSEFKWVDAKKVPDLEDLNWVLEKAIYPYIEFTSI
ncbi:MAG: NUDIX domain-containing protein [Candidatus Aenigmarchaeota archaeon]|nr:NUDIX domain-containing protein [Candidatus Aenigmarchaeota archaeon]